MQYGSRFQHVLTWSAAIIIFAAAVTVLVFSANPSNRQPVAQPTTDPNIIL